MNDPIPVSEIMWGRHYLLQDLNPQILLDSYYCLGDLATKLI